MRLTVGPLPPAVYWRRRAVIAALLLLLIVLIYSCSNAFGAAPRKRVLVPTSGSPAATASTARPKPVFTPSTGISDQAEDPPIDPGPPASGTPGSTDSPAGTASCTDGELAIAAVADPASAPRAAAVKFTLRIKNTSNHTCVRDVGAEPQELYLQDAAKVKVWSSDTCDPLHTIDVRTFKPGDEAEFYVVWNGRTNNTGCTNQQPPAVGRYQLVGRLATKLSDPGPLELR